MKSQVKANLKAGWDDGEGTVKVEGWFKKVGGGWGNCEFAKSTLDKKRKKKGAKTNNRLRVGGRDDLLIIIRLNFEEKEQHVRNLLRRKGASRIGINRE